MCKKTMIALIDSHFLKVNIMLLFRLFIVVVFIYQSSLVMGGAVQNQPATSKLAADDLNPKNIAPEVVSEQIRENLNNLSYRFSFRKDGEYAVKMYRTTGDKSYLNAILHELYISADRLSELSRGVYCATYRTQRIKREIDDGSCFLGVNKVCRALRSETARWFNDHIFYANLLLPELHRVSEFGMQLKNDNEKIIQKISAFDFEPGFTNPDMIRAWASRQAYQVYWLKDIDLGDYREIFTNSFKKVFPDNKDVLLSDQQYMTKITSMAHLVIAASGNFQEPVSDQSLEWITDYFEKNIDEIITRVESVIIAEVGISFLLMGKQSVPAVEKTKKAILSAYSPSQKMVQALDGNIDFDMAQIRNTLSIILLGWNNIYHSGPYFNKIKAFSEKLPSIIEPE